MQPTPSTAHTATAPAATARPPHTAVWRYLRALGADAAEADDLAQETMLVACEAGQGGEPTQCETPFLLGVARNLWLRSRRAWQRRREREIADAVDELWQQTAADDDGDELVARLRTCLDALQPRAREALDLHYRDGLPWREVSTRIGLQPNGTKTLAQRARQALRACIERRTS